MNLNPRISVWIRDKSGAPNFSGSMPYGPSDPLSENSLAFRRGFRISWHYSFLSRALAEGSDMFSTLLRASAKSTALWWVKCSWISGLLQLASPSIACTLEEPNLWPGDLQNPQEYVYIDEQVTGPSLAQKDCGTRGPFLMSNTAWVSPDTSSRRSFGL